MAETAAGSPSPRKQRPRPFHSEKYSFHARRGVTDASQYFSALPTRNPTLAGGKGLGRLDMSVADKSIGLPGIARPTPTRVLC